MTSITLRPVTRENWRETLTLTVRPDQQPFVADYAPVALIGLAKAYVGALGLSWIPYLIAADDESVGFVALAFQPDSADDYWIFHFFIDQHYQGKGYGKQALQALLGEARQRHPNCQAVQLTVNPENIPALRLYTSAGFAATGEQGFDDPIYRLTLKPDNGEPITKN